MIPKILFIGILCILCLLYRYHHTLCYPPQSIHAWRQADCASLSLNYYKHGMDFFKPTVHLLASEGGKSGHAATSEIPLFYYFVALLYHVFGPHEFLMKGMNLLIFLGGLIYLRKWFQKVLGDVFWASALSLLFFTSPLLVYYAGNYLTNASAFALGIIGFYHFHPKTGLDATLPRCCSVYA